MKVLMIAAFDKHSTNNSQSDGFKKNGWEVIEYPYRVVEQSIGPLARDKEIVKICKESKPDMVFFSKCNEVDISVVKECNKVSNTVLWYMDPSNSNFNDSLIKKIKFCSYTFCALVDPYKKSLEISPKSVYFLQEGFDEDANYPMDVPYTNDVSFIGFLRNERQRYFDALKFKVYHNVFNESHSKAVSETKINLNFTEGGTSDRTYKVLASRGFLLTQPWENMEKDFKCGEDLDTFSSIQELKEKIGFYLSNEETRLRIADHGYQTVQKFNRTNFSKRIIDVVYP